MVLLMEQSRWLRASIIKPESSAKAGWPEASAACFALRIAFSIKVAPKPIAKRGAIVGSILWSESPMGKLYLYFIPGITERFNAPIGQG